MLGVSYKTADKHKESLMKKLIPQVLGNVVSGEFTPGAIPLDKRAYGCKTVPEKYVR